MVEFKAYSKIDKASRDFADPVVLSTILLNQSMIAVNKKGKLAETLEVLKKYGVEHSKKNRVVYVVLKDLKNEWNIRILLNGIIIIALIIERSKASPILGGLAYTHLFKELYPENPIIRYNIGYISYDKLPETFRTYIEESLREKAAEKPPYIWLNKVIYDIYIDRIITDKGAYMYVLHGKDSLGREYAVKIPRERTIDGKPLAVGENTQGLMEVLRGIMNCLEVASSTKESLRKSLIARGYDALLADTLLYYRKYILRPRAIVILRDRFSEDEYRSIPPLILEDYATMGDLDTKIRKRTLSVHEAVFLGLRVAGAVALIHANHYVHMDIKPQNILLIEDLSEPYDYAPLLGDFIGLPHMFDSIIELKKSTPEYADPIALLRGKTSYNYDVYSVGVTLYYALMGKKLTNRILVNLLILKYIYGATVPLRVYLVENPQLVNKARRLEKIFKEYNSGRKKTLEVLIQEILSVIEDDDREEVKSLAKKIPTPLYEIITKTLTFNEVDRYPDGIAFWQDYLGIAKKLGYTNLIPHK